MCVDSKMQMIFLHFWVTSDPILKNYYEIRAIRMAGSYWILRLSGYMENNGSEQYRAVKLY